MNQSNPIHFNPLIQKATSLKFQTKFEDQITLILWKIIGYEYLYSVAIIKKEKKEKKKGIWLYGYDKFSPYVHRETMTT